MTTMTLTPGEKLLVARRRAGLSTTELAALAGCSPAMISYLERDLRQPSLALLRRLALRLEVSPAWLAGLDDAPVDGAVTARYQTSRAA